MESFQMAKDSAPLSLSQSFILPEEKRPQLSKVSNLASIPIIDLSVDHINKDGASHEVLLDKITEACEEYGFFHIINHGVPQDLCKRMLTAISDLFKLPPQERSKLFSTDHTKEARIMNYYLKFQNQDKVTMWSENFSHPWDPNGDFATLLPENPPQYREVFVEYAKEINNLMEIIFGLISQSLGLEKNCLQSKLGEKPILKAQANFYPPCPDPELTLGLAVHTDLSALTVLMQSEEVSGLQVIKDGSWVDVKPVPDAFVINLGDQLQVLSNGRYKSVHHRAVTNKMLPRISLAMFYGPNKNTWIGPIEELVDEEHSPIYRRFKYSDFIEEFNRQEGTRRRVKEAFELQQHDQNA
ncbi:protein DOWNY MILDEW RESISTANCE 6-like [Humulus lupulus]|uniref:protein DOWNY MILDEW RESISTANCE 6-like n=1 Tax=Humulus lupulus TaxID=3486 RepID=UPI002B410C29|nr:protein DOWNY MILDEW RESISTANCE 6-like [Humulus lupulus]